MSYTKQTWQTGDIITADKLNHMEDGISSAQIYSVSEDVRFSGSVNTLESEVGYWEEINCDLSDAPEQIKVTFDGTEYTCGKISIGSAFGYGGIGATGPDFSEYPFAISYSRGDCGVFTETASTHQVEIAAVEKAVNQDLADAIPVMRLISGVTNSADAVAAFNAGKLLYFTYEALFYVVTGINNTNDGFIYTPSGDTECDFSGDKIFISPGAH